MERFQGIEREGSLDAPNVPVIALFPVIVAAQDAYTSHHESQSRFAGVPAAGNRYGQVPRHDFAGGRIISHRAGLLDQFGLYVVMSNNIQECCQSEQRTP